MWRNTDGPLPEVDPNLESSVVGQRVPVSGPTAKLVWDKAVAIGDVEVVPGRFGGKVYPNGGGVSTYEFKVTRDGVTEEVSMSAFSDNGPFDEAELIARGRFLVFRATDERDQGSVGFEVTNVGATQLVLPAELPENDEETARLERMGDLCHDRIEAAMVRGKLSLAKSSRGGVQDGVYVRTDEDVIGHCGLVSGRIWFTKGRGPRKPYQ